MTEAVDPHYQCLRDVVMSLLSVFALREMLVNPSASMKLVETKQV